MEENFNIIQKKLNHAPLSPKEQMWFNVWVTSNDNLKQFEAYQKVWNLTGVNKKLNPDVNQQWDRFKANHISKNIVRKINRRHWYIVTSVAAVLLVSLFIGVIFKSGLADQKYIALNQPIEIQLPDMSTVTLNAQSTLIVKGGFDDARIVKLQGEAVFKVQKNAEIPFIVEINKDHFVKVIGTQFNLRSVALDQDIYLQVIEGKVQIGNPKNNLFVSGGEEVAYQKATGRFTDVKELNPNKIAWYTKNFEFNNTPINEVVEFLEQYMNKRIEIPQTAEDLRYTGSFNNANENEVLETISLAMGWDYKITRKTIVFSNKKIR